MSVRKSGKASSVVSPQQAATEKELPATIVKPVDNAIRILRYLNIIGKPSTVTLIARELKINASTCFNILRTLVWNGVIDFDSVTKSYKTGLGAVDLASNALRNGGDVVEVMQPLMEKVAQTYGITITVWRRVGEDRMMLVKLIDSSATVRIHLHLGQRLPLLVGAAGRVMAAFGQIDDAEIKRRFPQVRWSRPPTVAEYLQQVKKAQKNGWAVDDGNFLAGIFSTAAPIFNREGTLRGAVDATMLRGQHDKATAKIITAEVKQLADSFTSGHPLGAGG